MKKTMNVKGMHCKSCEMLIKDSVGELKGMNNVDVSLIKNTVTVDFDEKTLDESKIKKTIEAEGYIVRK